MLDVVCVGEALVDFLPEAVGEPVREVERWVRCLGGAPANVTVGVARLGGRSSALVGVTGDDEFGHFLAGRAAKEGVDVSHLRQTNEGKTGLGFVSLDRGGRAQLQLLPRPRGRVSARARRRRPGLRGAGQGGALRHQLAAAAERRARRRWGGPGGEGARAAGVDCDPNLQAAPVARAVEQLRKLLDELMPRCTV